MKYQLLSNDMYINLDAIESVSRVYMEEYYYVTMMSGVVHKIMDSDVPYPNDKRELYLPRKIFIEMMLENYDT